MSSDVKFGHGLKANIQKALDNGKFDEDDFIIASDTDDELIFIGHNKSINPIKSRTNEDIILTTEAIGALEENFTVPAGTSIDDLLNMLKDWLADNKDTLIADINAIHEKMETVENIQQMIDDSIKIIVNNAPYNLDTLGEIAAWINQNEEAIYNLPELQKLVEEHDLLIQDLFDETQDLAEDIVILQGDTEQLQGDVEQLQGDTEQLQEDVVELQEQIKEIGVEVIDYDLLFEEEDALNG